MIVYYGILEAGAVVVPLNILLKADEIAYHLQDCGAATYLCYAGGADLPIGTYGRAAFGEAPSCHTMFVIGTDDDTDEDGITPLSTVLPAQSTVFESVAT